MPKQPRILSGDYQNDLSALQELLDDFARGLDDAYVRDGAGIRFTKLRMVDLGKVVVGTDQVALRHKLPGRPTLVNVEELANINVWQSQERDQTFIYLTASGSGTVRVTVGF